MTRKAVNWKQVVAHYLYDRDNGICQLCGKELNTNDRLDIDHIIRISNGGTDDMNNLRLVHTLCHLERHTPQKMTLNDNVVGFDKLKTQAMIKQLRNIKKTYLQKGSMKESAQAHGWTLDQCRYYAGKYGFSGTADKWDFA